MPVAPGCLIIAVKTRTELDAALDEAVDVLKPAAMAGQVGISVTRTAPGRYEARLNSEVPPGMTIERWGTGRSERETHDVAPAPGRQRVPHLLGQRP